MLVIEALARHNLKNQGCQTLMNKANASNHSRATSKKNL